MTMESLTQFREYPQRILSDLSFIYVELLRFKTQENGEEREKEKSELTLHFD